MSERDGVATDRFAEAYQDQAPWDIGRPQAAIQGLIDQDLIEGSVLDVGCGTGEHALLAAEHGHEAWGIDAVPRAIELARAKAEARGLAATFRVHDALALGEMGRRFDTLLDIGLFHVFGDEARAVYVESLAEAIEPGGRYHMLVFSDEEPTDWGGPRRISRGEIREAFGDGWRVEAIEAATFETLVHDEEAGGGRAWLATVTRA